MANGDNKWKSRKFAVAGASFLAVTVMAFYGVFKVSETAQDIVIIIGAWGVVDAAILKLYTDANLKARGLQ